MYKTSVIWFSVLLWSVVQADLLGKLPLSKINTKDNCTGHIAFSSTGSSSVQSTGRPVYKQNDVNLTTSWNREAGVFTCNCPGLYQFSFSGSTEEKTRMVLKKSSNKGKQWTPIIATKPGGGSVTILLEVKNGDQVAVYLDGKKKKFNTKDEENENVTSFSGYRIAKS